MSPTPRNGTTARQDGPAPAREEFQVPVPGGRLAVSRWPAHDPGVPVVLALHGITADGLSWARVAHHLVGRVTLVAPDLRGRGGSGGLPGPYGNAAHADDMAAVVDALGVGRVVLTGHSTGAFAAALTAVRHPRHRRPGRPGGGRAPADRGRCGRNRGSRGHGDLGGRSLCEHTIAGVRRPTTASGAGPVAVPASVRGCSSRGRAAPG